MRFTLSIVLIFFLTACQPSKIVHTWTANEIAPKKFNKILVLGVLAETDAVLQQNMENHLADDLRQKGYLAVAANKIFPAGTFIKGDTAKARMALQGSGFDGILTIVLIDKKNQPYYVPGKTVHSKEPGKQHRFDEYYNAVSEQIYSPGYYGTETKYIWENNFYDINKRQLIYSAQSRSFDYTSKETLAHTYGQLMTYNLIKRKVLINTEQQE